MVPFSRPTQNFTKILEASFSCKRETKVAADIVATIASAKLTEQGQDPQEVTESTLEPLQELLQDEDAARIDFALLTLKSLLDRLEGHKEI